MILELNSLNLFKKTKNVRKKKIKKLKPLSSWLPLDFQPLFLQAWENKLLIHNQISTRSSDMESVSSGAKRNSANFGPKVKVGKMKIKTGYFSFFQKFIL